jgi:hypothetical protein
MKKKTEIEVSLEKERAKVLRQIFGLNEKFFTHLKESAVATQICTYCTIEGKAAKTDSDGKCIQCHGTNLVPDMRRRDWAFEEGFGRSMPKPKATEMTIEHRQDLDALKSTLSKKSDKEIAELAEKLEISFADE